MHNRLILKTWLTEERNIQAKLNGAIDRQNVQAQSTGAIKKRDRTTKLKSITDNVTDKRHQQARSTCAFDFNKRQG